MFDFIDDWIKDILLSIDGDIENVVTILKDDWFNPSNDIYVYDFIMGVQDIITPIALIIITICFLIEFLKITIQMDILKWEYGLKCFFKLAFAKVCIEGSTLFLGAIYSTATEWASNIGTTSVTLGSDMWALMEPMLADLDGWSKLGVVMSSGITLTALSLSVLIIEVMAYARNFEISLLLAVAPLPCAFLPLEDGGMSRIPVKYVLSFASTCLAGVFMIMSVRLYGVIALKIVEGAVSRGLNGMLGRVLLATLVLVMAIVKSGGWASKVFEGA